MMQFLSDPWLKEHQTLAAAFVAFAGTFVTVLALICGYLLNARLNRAQLDRNRHQDAIALAAILMAEINAVRHQAKILDEMFGGLIDHAREKHKPDDQTWDSLEIGFAKPFQFEKIAEKFGLLGPHLAFEVSNFYFMYLDVFSALEKLPNKKIKNTFVLAVFPSFQRGLKLVAEKGAEVVPQLVAFTVSRNLPKPDLKWFVRIAERPAKFYQSPNYPKLYVVDDKPAPKDDIKPPSCS